MELACLLPQTVSRQLVLPVQAETYKDYTYSSPPPPPKFACIDKIPEQDEKEIKKKTTPS